MDGWIYGQLNRWVGGLEGGRKEGRKCIMEERKEEV